jgi:hypothetical protein
MPTGESTKQFNKPKSGKVKSPPARSSRDDSNGSMAAGAATNLKSVYALAHSSLDFHGQELALQRHFERFPFFQFFYSVFPMGLVGLVVAPGMILYQYQEISGLTFGIWKTAFKEQARLGQGQRGSFF